MRNDLNPKRCIGQVRLEDTLKFDERLVVKYHTLEIFRADAGFLQAVGNGVGGKAEIVLLPRKTFFLRRGDDFAVTNQGRSGIMIIARNAENVQ